MAEHGRSLVRLFRELELSYVFTFVLSLQLGDHVKLLYERSILVLAVRKGPDSTFPDNIFPAKYVYFGAVASAGISPVSLLNERSLPEKERKVSLSKDWMVLHKMPSDIH